jgi:hypothetical protein
MPLSSARSVHSAYISSPRALSPLALRTTFSRTVSCPAPPKLSKSATASPLDCWHQSRLCHISSVQLVHPGRIPAKYPVDRLLRLAKLGDDLSKQAVPSIRADGLIELCIARCGMREVRERKGGCRSKDNTMGPKGLNGRRHWLLSFDGCAIDAKPSPYILRALYSSSSSCHQASSPRAVAALTSTTGGNALRYTLACSES